MLPVLHLVSYFEKYTEEMIGLKLKWEDERKKAEAAAKFHTPPVSGSFQGVSFRKMNRDSSNKKMTIEEAEL